MLTQVTDLEAELDALLRRYSASGGVLDYMFFQGVEPGTPLQLHRAAALSGMAILVGPTFDGSKLAGEPVSYRTFWGTDDVEKKPIGQNAWSIPNIDGYKTAFFHPPHHMRGESRELNELFAAINRFVLGKPPESAEIFAWSTDWSRYFDAGHEWWGAFYWTIRPADSQRFTVIGASTTD